jgi:hypothetical protein
MKALGADTCAQLKRSNGRTERHDRARDLVAENLRQAVSGPQRAVALDNVVVRHADGADFKQRFVRLWSRVGPFLQSENGGVAVGAQDNGSHGLKAQA